MQVTARRANGVYYPKDLDSWLATNRVCALATNRVRSFPRYKKKALQWRHVDGVSAANRATDAVTLPATAPEELPKDHAEDDLPALQASSDSDEDTTEVMENGPPASTARDLGSPPSVIQQIGGFITII